MIHLNLIRVIKEVNPETSNLVGSFFSVQILREGLENELPPGFCMQN